MQVSEPYNLDGHDRLQWMQTAAAGAYFTAQPNFLQKATHPRRWAASLEEWEDKPPTLRETIQAYRTLTKVIASR